MLIKKVQEVSQLLVIKYFTSFIVSEEINNQEVSVYKDDDDQGSQDVGDDHGQDVVPNHGWQ